MRKIVTGVLALSMVTSMAMAHVKKYASVGMAADMVEAVGLEFDSGYAGEVRAGMIWHNNFGLEAKLSKSIIASSYKEDGAEIEFDITTFSVFATYDLEIDSGFFVVPKIGFTHYATDVSMLAGKTELFSEDDGNTNISYGLDLKYNIDKELKAYAGFTIFNPEINGNDFDSNQIYFGIQKYFQPNH